MDHQGSAARARRSKIEQETGGFATVADVADAWAARMAADGRRPAGAPTGAPGTDGTVEAAGPVDPVARRRELRLAPPAADPRPHRPAAAGEPAPAAGERRTVVIRGQVADRHAVVRRPPRSIQERATAKPDRIAMWAVLLGVLLIVVAASSAHL